MIIEDYEKKLLQLEKLIESTPYEGERFIAKKKYAKLKAKYVSKKQKRDVWYALHLWKSDVTPETVNAVYEKSARKNEVNRLSDFTCIAVFNGEHSNIGFAVDNGIIG